MFLDKDVWGNIIIFYITFHFKRKWKYIYLLLTTIEDQTIQSICPSLNNQIK